MSITLSQYTALSTRIVPASIACEDDSGLPALFTAVQCILESGWLTRMAGKNNCFGIKEYFKCAGRELIKTQEWFTDLQLRQFLAKHDQRTATLILADSGTPERQANGRLHYTVQDWFATFPSLADCFAYHSRLLLGPNYAPALTQYKLDREIDRYIHGIADAGYATSPDYATSLISVARMDVVRSEIDKFRTSLVGYRAK